MKFGFEDIKLNRITADVAIENKACIAVLKKLKLQKEGVSRQCIWAQDKWWDEAQYAILCEEYFGSIQ